MSALSFLASLGTGYLREDEKKAEREKADAREARQRQREDTADARATELYDAGKAERARVTADRDLIRNAAQPVPIAPEATMPAAMDARDIGQPGEAPVPVTGYKVGAARFAERAAAEAESGRQTQARVATALDTVDPAGAQGRKTSALQGQAAELQVKAARDADAAKDWTRKAGAAIVQSGSWDEATRFMTESKADGLDGSTKWQHTVSPDGATVTVFPAGPDGKPQAKGFTVPNTDKGRLQLLMTLDQNTPASAKLADLRAEENAAATRENLAKDNARADRQLTLQEQNASAQRAQLGMQQAQFRLTRAAAEAEAKIPPAVKMQYATVDAELKQIGTAMAKSMAEGQYDPANKGTQELMLRQRELTTIAQRILAPYVKVPDAAPGAGGADPLGLFADPGKPAAPGAVPAKPPAAAPQGPGVVARLASRGVDAVRGAVASNQAEGAAYQAIDARVRQAGAGGPPLTPEEVALARRFAIATPN